MEIVNDYDGLRVHCQVDEEVEFREMKKVIIEYERVILDDQCFSSEVKRVLACKARRRDVDLEALSCQALRDVGLCLCYGYRIRKDKDKAFEYLINCLDKGYAEKFPGLGEVAYYLGLIAEEQGIPFDDWFYKLSSDEKYSGGKFRYGLVLLDDRRKTYNYEEGMGLIEEAVQEEWPPAIEFMEKYGKLL